MKVEAIDPEYTCLLSILCCYQIPAAVVSVMLLPGTFSDFAQTSIVLQYQSKVKRSYDGIIQKKSHILCNLSFFHFHMCFLEVIIGVHGLAVPAQSAQKYCIDTTALKFVRVGRKSTVESLLSRDIQVSNSALLSRRDTY